MRGTLIVLGMGSLFILGIVGTVGAREFRPQLLAASRRLRAANRVASSYILVLTAAAAGCYGAPRRWLDAAWARMYRELAELPPFMAHPGAHADPARAVSASARRKPPGVESLAAAGTVPDVGAAWPGGPASGTASRLVTTGELALLHARAHRPVNGRRLPDQPRTYGQIPVASVLADERRLEEERQAARAQGERVRLTGVITVPDPRVLERVRDGLLALPKVPAVYGHCGHCNEGCTDIHARPCEPGCPGAELIGGAK